MTGRFIVLEGADGAGRSTQAGLLKAWLEGAGHAVLETGLRRSDLLRSLIDQVKAGNAVGSTTLGLLYATDLAQEVEHRIRPALRAGFVVVADRYIYSAMARQLVRGARPKWLEKLFGFALAPEAVIYLHTTPEERLQRTLAKDGRLDYWESGMDMGLAADRCASFLKYQRRLQKRYDQLAQKYGFVTVNAAQGKRAVAAAIRTHVQGILEGGEVHGGA
ncbi:MAG TPA: dTMP kinase [Symbiobacteriaceae bacterium]|jgi:dTMP kinase|nr:dTMP kinase [Symbiobacteriaceae bacterium]